MKLKFSVLWLSAVILLAPALLVSQNIQTDRIPAVAGQFYPDDPNDLREMLRTMFSKAVQSKGLKNVVAIIAPHAGYVYSGVVAASAYNQIDFSKEYENIFILGPSHHVGFEGAAVYNRGNFITPLGTVHVNTKLANDLIKRYDFFSGRTDAHQLEHSIEVQIPFLQYKLQKIANIVPIVFGANPPDVCKKIADVLRPYFNTKNLFIISTDFSHYPSYADAKGVDRASVDAILSNSSKHLIQTIGDNAAKNIPDLVTSMCGEFCVMTLLCMTENNPDVQFTHIQYMNSGDVSIGTKDKVVGYNAIAVTLKGKGRGVNFKLDEQDKHSLIEIARTTIEEYVRHGKIPTIDDGKLSAAVKVDCGAFVTLKKGGELRGCIGRFDATESLYKVVQKMAIAASTQDYRFHPVASEELGKIEIEISVLTPLRKIKSIDEIVMGKNGIYIRKGSSSGTFLPQVATETGWSKEEFLGHCAQDKAGIGWDGWRNAELFIYESLIFDENEFKKK
jgi:hypothetical protein